MTHYANDKLFTIPGAFTALNGASQIFELTSNVEKLDVEPIFDKGELKNEKEYKTAQANLLRVLEILRSNGAQPIITNVKGGVVTFTLEQTHVFGKRDHANAHTMQVSSVEDYAKAACDDIKEIFGKAKAVEFDVETKTFESTDTDLFGSVKVVATIGALVG